MDFFLRGVEETANQAAETAGRLIQLFQKDRARLHAEGRKGLSALKLHEILQKNPIVTVPRLVTKFGFSAPTANSALRLLVALDLVREITGQKRHRVFSYHEYLRTLNEGTELPT